MEVISFYLSLLSALLWWAVLLVPWRPWSSAPFLESARDFNPALDLSNVSVLIPARNEADTIVGTLRGVQSQGQHLSIILVDDQSTDATAALALMAAPTIQLVQGQPLPEQWSGKLWALEQGRALVQTPLTLLLDADVALQPGVIGALRAELQEQQLGLISLMATPSMVSGWERLLMPAFIYFFKLLYPFHLSNDPGSKIAAAAGGCILIKTELLAEMGGFSALKGALIDDCTLARNIKARGHPIWIGLSRSACSQRPYPNLTPIWAMVARTAFTQLHYSISLLLLCTAIMLLVFWVPVAGLFQAGAAGFYLSLAALLAMLLSYLPVLRYYGRSAAWALCLPFIGSLYLLMTWSSAVRYWRGERASWKERVYARSDHLISSGKP